MVCSFWSKIQEKTVVLPVGTSEYRENIISTHTIQKDNPHSLPNTIQILKDGETTHCLGASIGNKKEGCEPWPKIIEDIENSLCFWDKGYPGLEGRKHIIKMEIGGKTQFTTWAQGMPAVYKKYLTKRIRTYIWGSEVTPTIATNLLTKCKESADEMSLIYMPGTKP